MLTFLARRTLSAAAMLYVIATIVFSILLVIPGDPAELLLGAGERSVTPEAVEALRIQMGLNRPIMEQYLTFLLDLLRFDFGVSMIDGSSIADNIAMRLPRTLELIGVAALIALIIAIPAGTMAALKIGSAFDKTASAISAFFMSIPVFVVGTLFIYVFAQFLGILPAGGYVAFSQAPLAHLATLLLPAVSVSLNLMPIIYRMVRGSVLEVRGSDWVRTAQAKGLSWRKVVRRHILRNALGPVVTVVGIQLGILLGSTVLIEYVYNWPGLSGFLVTAVEQRDYPIVRAVIMTVAALFIFINLVVEIIHSLLDPRIQLA